MFRITIQTGKRNKSTEIITQTGKRNKSTEITTQTGNRNKIISKHTAADIYLPPFQKKYRRLNMEIVIIGAGNAGKATAAYLLSMRQPSFNDKTDDMHDSSYKVRLITGDAKKAAETEKNGLTASGRITGNFRSMIEYSPYGTGDIRASKADVIIVQTVAGAHRDVAERLKGHLGKNQLIIIFNGNWGAAEFESVLGAEAREKKTLICETAAQLFLCSSPDINSVNITGIKESVGFAVSDMKWIREACERAVRLFPGLKTAENIIDTSANSSNPVIHGPIAAFNITRLENGEDYTLFGTALPEKLIRYIEKADLERCAVIEALGTKATGVLEILNSFWPVKRESLRDALKENEAYRDIKGPKTLLHRYIEEDIPYGLVPLSVLGKKLGVPTPYTDSVITGLSLYLGRDFMKEGPSEEALISNMRPIIRNK